jgi:hypothetical protein
MSFVICTGDLVFMGLWNTEEYDGIIVQLERKMEASYAEFWLDNLLGYNALKDKKIGR